MHSKYDRTKDLMEIELPGKEPSEALSGQDLEKEEFDGKGLA